MVKKIKCLFLSNTVECSRTGTFKMVNSAWRGASKHVTVMQQRRRVNLSAWMCLRCFISLTICTPTPHLCFHTHGSKHVLYCSSQQRWSFFKALYAWLWSIRLLNFNRLRISTKFSKTFVLSVQPHSFLYEPASKHQNPRFYMLPVLPNTVVLVATWHRLSVSISS